MDDQDIGSDEELSGIYVKAYEDVKGVNLKLYFKAVADAAYRLEEYAGSLCEEIELLEDVAGAYGFSLDVESERNKLETMSAFMSAACKAGEINSGLDYDTLEKCKNALLVAQKADGALVSYGANLSP